eukprot:TRINITY_DN15064_c0_g2_i2.p2 TRINITY_DN15064_c0_g2~~TRINITY_DN15064_c0_g2_i2.p2  ORF type:complete len:190 (-),score=32.88 TRINITY_DN15064_c0_g2_i2:18-587(-)
MANDCRRQKSTTVRIGLESRFPNDPKRNKGTPGPHYNPQLKQEIPIPPKYTFGFRREQQGKSALAPNVSTPDIIGPGHYMKQQIPWISSLCRKPTYSIPKAERVGPEQRTFDKYQTYDYKQKAIGPQVNSRKATMPEISIGRAKRNNSAGMLLSLIHISEPTRQAEISYAVFCLKKKKKNQYIQQQHKI